MKNLLLSLLFLTSAAKATVELQPKRIIGEDTRYRVFQMQEVHKSIGLLYLFTGNDKTVGVCTGTVISNKHVLTAAHCLEENYSLIDEVVFIPAINGPVDRTNWPYGSFRSKKFRIMKDYFNSPTSQNDVGLITFSKNLPVKAIPLAVLPKSKTNIIIAGYPGDKNIGELWEGSGKRNLGFFFGGVNHHDVDTFSGQSGAAVRAYFDGKDKIVGVHSRGLPGTFYDHNEASFFTDKTIKTINEWIRADK